MDQAKLCTHLALKLDTIDSDDNVPIIVWIASHPDMVKAMIPDIAADHFFKLTPTIATTATKKEILRLTDDPRVEMIWQDKVVHTCLDISVPLIEAPRVWGEGFRGAGVRVAVVDTGIDADHPALAGRVIAAQDLTGEGLADMSGHGTHVAGIIAGNNDKYKGVAPEAELMNVKVLSGDGSGMTGRVMIGLEWAVMHGAQVINLSLGVSGATDGTDPLSRTCDIAVDYGLVVCVAVGNDGPGGGTVGSPGCAHKVITVGASTDQDAVADFSSRGPTADGREKPDVLFPGYGIISARAAGTDLGQIVNDYYTAASGTSMATPHASGAAALLLEAKPDLSPAQVKGLLMHTAKDLGFAGNTQGAGRAQVYQAYKRDVSTIPVPVPPEIPPPLPPIQRIGCLPTLTGMRAPRLP